MLEPLVIAAAQPLTVSGDVAGNAQRHAAAVRACDARLVVFPELSLSGYELDAPRISTSDSCLEPIVDSCRAMGSVALVGAPVAEEDGRSHIAMLAVDADGARVVYRKMWLGALEQDHFSPSETPATYTIDGWRLGLAICKDTGVSKHAANTAALGMDAYIAGVLETADDAQVQPERARRIAEEHAVWVVIASFAGSTGGGYSKAAGESGVWHPDGSLATQADARTGAFVRMSIGA